MIKMTKELASQIYDILVGTCGANLSEKEDFVSAQTDQLVSEWRFQGRLGFGGKFWRNYDRWYVNCYPEDLTPEIAEMIQDANLKIAVIYSYVQGRADAVHAVLAVVKGMSAPEEYLGTDAGIGMDIAFNRMCILLLDLKKSLDGKSETS
jgi:hypothetical protein